MRKTLLLLFVTALIISGQAFAYKPAHHLSSTQAESASQGGQMTAEERAALIALLEKTKADFIASIKNVSEAQWTFKPNPLKWSVEQTAEHIIQSEDVLFGFSQQLLKTPAKARLSSANQGGDQKLESIAEDRSQKFMNPAILKPNGAFKTPADAIAEFTKRRDRNIEYVRITKDDLRAHFTPLGPRGQMDAYQFLILMASHSERHTAQIHEVESNPKYPQS